MKIVFKGNWSKNIDLVYNELSINFFKLLKSGKKLLSKKNAKMWKKRGSGEFYKKKSIVFHRVFHNLCKKLRKLLWKSTNADKKSQWMPVRKKGKDTERNDNFFLTYKNIINIIDMMLFCQNDMT